LPSAGRLVFSDGAAQLEIDTNDADIRRDFRATYAHRVQAAKKFLLQRQAPVIALSTAAGVVEQLRGHLGKDRR
jgi:hypothetical protein